MHRVPFRTIRRAFGPDLAALRELVEAAAWGLSLGDYDAGQIRTLLRYGAGVDEQIIADRTYYVIEAEGRIVAGGGWSFRPALVGRASGDGDDDDDDDVLDPSVDAARLRGFCVHPDFARRGLARWIVHLCEHAAVHAGFRGWS